MTGSIPHIGVCICTFKRPALLERLLDALGCQETNGKFTFSVVVVDNDAAGSAREVVEASRQRALIAIAYQLEPRQNIALARNRALSASEGSFHAFIDDDECPPPKWLLTLWSALTRFDAAGVLGPVDPEFESGAPEWVKRGGFFDRPTHPTGMKLEWRQCRTGNVLFRSSILDGLDEPFNPACLSGEDQDFFRRCIERGFEFVWCHEAGVHEFVPQSRWKRGFLVRRALFRGIFAQRNHGLQPLRLAQAVVSTPIYLLLLPFALIRGETQFMICLFKLSYHAGRLLGLLHINPIRQPYVSS